MKYKRITYDMKYAENNMFLDHVDLNMYLTALM